MPKSMCMKRFHFFPALLLVGAAASFGAVAVHAGGATALRPTFETSAEVGLSANASPTVVTNSSPTPEITAVAPAETAAGEARVDATLTVVASTPTARPLTAVESASPVAQMPAVLSQEPELLSDAEKSAQLLHKMNDARANSGLDTLTADAELDEVALVRARDLVENGYFDHYSPAGENAFTELGVRGIGYRLAGENLARNNYPESKTIIAAYEGLMGSEGHRANILEPRFSRAGIAVVKSGKLWYYVTVFAD